jgi:hypothetical protein
MSGEAIGSRRDHREADCTSQPPLMSEARRGTSGPQVHYRTTIRQSSGCMTTTGHRLVAAQRPQSRRGDDRHQHASQPETPSIPRGSLDQDAVLPRAWSCRTAFARIAWCSSRRRCLRDATASPHPGQHRSRAPLLAAATTASSPPRLTRAVTGPERRRGRGSHPTRPINFVDGPAGAFASASLAND